MPTSLHPLAYFKYIFGDVEPIKWSEGIATVSKFAVGRYRLTLEHGSDFASRLLVNQGVAFPQVSGAFKVAADFVDETTVEVQIHSLVSGALADPPNGTRVIVVIWN